MPAATAVYGVLYTQQLTKKAKRWLDGRVKRLVSGSAQLLDEEGRVLAACAKVPAGLCFADCEGAACFDGFLVNGDCQLEGDSSPPEQLTAALPAMMGPVKPAAPAPKPTATSRRLRQVPASTTHINNTTSVIQAPPTWSDADILAALCGGGSSSQAGYQPQLQPSAAPGMPSRTSSNPCTMPEELTRPAQPRIPILARSQRPAPAAAPPTQAPRPTGTAGSQQQQHGMGATAAAATAASVSAGQHKGADAAASHLAVDTSRPWHDSTAGATGTKAPGLIGAQHQQQLPQQQWQGAHASSSSGSGSTAAHARWSALPTGGAGGGAVNEEAMAVQQMSSSTRPPHQMQRAQWTAQGVQQGSVWQEHGPSIYGQNMPQHGVERQQHCHQQQQQQRPPPYEQPEGHQYAQQQQQQQQNLLESEPGLQYVKGTNPQQPSVAASVNHGWTAPSKPPLFRAPGPAPLADISNVVRPGPAALCGKPSSSASRGPAAAIATTGSLTDSNHAADAGNLQFRFPSQLGGPATRCMVVPTSFSSSSSSGRGGSQASIPPQVMYRNTLADALVEEVNLRLAEHARHFFNIVQQVSSYAPSHSAAGGSSSANSSRGAARAMHGGAAAGQGAGPALLGQLQAACARQGLQYCPGSALNIYVKSKQQQLRFAKGSAASRKRGRGSRGKRDDAGDAEASGSDAEQDEGPQRSAFLTLGGNIDRRKLRKHDLWVLSSHPLFGAPNTAASISDRQQQQQQQQPPPRPTPTAAGPPPGILLVRSLWHGPDRDGRMAVELLPGGTLQLSRQQQVTALLGPDVTTDVQMVEALRGRAWQQQWPLWGPLLHTPPVPVQAAAAAAAAGASSIGAPQDGLRSAAAAAVVQRFGLNDGQAAVVDHVAAWQQQLLRGGGLGGRQPRGRLLLRPSTQQMPTMSDAAAAGAGSEALNTSSSSSSSSRRAPICLIHGPFGSGKSTLLCALIHLITGVRSASPPADAAPAAVVTVGCGAAGNRLPLTGPVAGVTAGDATASPEEPDARNVPAGEGNSFCQIAADSEPDEDILVAQRRRRRTGTCDDGAAGSSKRRKLSRQQQGRAAGGGSAPIQELDIADLLEDSSEEEEEEEGWQEEDDFPPVTGKLSRADRSSNPATAAAAPGPAAHMKEEEDEGQEAGQAAQQQPSHRKRRGQATSSASSAASTAAGAWSTNGVRVLVAAHTNVAVDRVLLGLVEAGFTDVLRVGSVPRIAKPLLQYSLHSADDSKDAVVQLQGMLRDASGQDEQLIRAELAALQAGAERQRRKRLRTAAVVGITCCACLQSLLEGVPPFDVVLLDEASQMTEPLSLLPLMRAQPRFLIAAGDPCQLPPVLCAPAHITGATAGPGRGAPGQQQLYGLLRPLYVRLTQLGHQPHLLTHQYRCHPAIAALPNRYFYNGRLVDGITPHQRAPLLPGLAPLSFCDTSSSSAQLEGNGSRSSINRAEAQLAVRLVVTLLQGQTCSSVCEEQPAGGAGAGVVAAEQLGVICLFRAQANLIKQQLLAEGGAAAAGVQVATVDSFQGAQKEVIFLATTATNPGEFCRDAARLNVALSRAKRHLVVLGAGAALSRLSPVFRDLVDACQRTHNSYYPSNSMVPALAKVQAAAAVAGEQDSELSL